MPASLVVGSRRVRRQRCVLMMLAAVCLTAVTTCSGIRMQRIMLEKDETPWRQRRVLQQEGRPSRSDVFQNIPNDSLTSLNETQAQTQSQTQTSAGAAGQQQQQGQQRSPPTAEGGTSNGTASTTNSSGGESPHHDVFSGVHNSSTGVSTQTPGGGATDQQPQEGQQSFPDSEGGSSNGNSTAPQGDDSSGGNFPNGDDGNFPNANNANSTNLRPPDVGSPDEVERPDDVDPPGGGRRAPKVMFGTKSGYDMGGVDPLCWEATYSTVNATNDTALTNHLEQSNNNLFELADAASLRPQCYTGTSFTMIARDLPTGNDMFMDQPYNFLLNLTMNLTEVLKRSQLQAEDLGGVMDVYFRLHLCDAIKQGFCNPIADTREVDANLTRIESDVGVGQNDVGFPANDSKWFYKEGTILRALTDDTTNASTMDGMSNNNLFTRWCKWKFRENPNNPGIFTTKINIRLQAQRSTGITDLLPRAYFILGHAELDWNLGNDEIHRLDIAQTPAFRVVFIKPQPEILYVTTGCKAFLGVVIALSGSFALYCLVITILHGKHPVMQLAQGKFLALMTAACLVQIVFSFTFLPVKDEYCEMQGLIVLVPLTVVAAIMAGRVWRIYSALSSVSSLGQQASQSTASRLQRGFISGLDFLAGLWTYFRCCNKIFCCCRSDKRSANKHQQMRRRRSSLRRTVTAEDTACLISILTLPQIVIQVVGLIVVDLQDEGGLITEYNELGNIGRVVCHSDGCLARWFNMAGTVYASLVFLLAVLMAWFSRDLPSAFNEKDQIFTAATISCILTAMSIGLGEVINQPTTSPDADVILKSSVAIGVATSVLFLIVWPKVVRVLRGEKVVVSKMLGSQYAASSTVTETDVSHHYETESFKPRPSFRIEEEKINSPLILHEDDPIPTHIETKIFDLQSLLRNVMIRSGDGRSLSKEQWKQLQQEIGKIKSDLDLVNVDSFGLESSHQPETAT